MNIGYKNVWGYTNEDVTKYTKQPKIKLLSDGQVFDLGGRKVMVYYCPGHSRGECTFLDNKSRILFSGDAANGNVGTRIPVSTTVRYLIRLQKLRTEYDRMYTGHISYAGTINAVSQNPRVLDDGIEAFRSLLRGDAKIQEVQNHLFPERKQTVAVMVWQGLALIPLSCGKKMRNTLFPRLEILNLSINFNEKQALMKS